jgi:hypothetical protein
MSSSSGCRACWRRAAGPLCGFCVGPRSRACRRGSARCSSAARAGVREERILVLRLDHLAARASAASTSPSLRSERCGALLRRARPPAREAPRCSARRGALVPRHAQPLRARAARPTRCRPRWRRRRAGRSSACRPHHEGVRTPGMRADLVEVGAATLPPNTGHFSNTAYSMPGTRDVDAEERLAGDDGGVVHAAARRADDRKSFGSLSGTVCEVGRRQRGGRAASSP